MQIPLATAASSAARKPQYLTSYTKGIDLQAFQNGTYSGYVFYPLSALQSNCSSAGGTLTCKLALQAPIGAAQILVHTYDGTTATSNILSVASANTTIVAAQTNTVAITTLPIAASFQFATGTPTCVLVGSPSSANITYTALDADGGALTGLTLGNALVFANANTADSSPGVTITPSTVTAGSGTLALAYNGSDANLAVYTGTLSMSATGATNVTLAATSIIPVTTTGPHVVYVADSANDQIYSFDICTANSGNVTTTSHGLPAGTSAQKVRYDRHSPNGDPRLFVAAGTGNKLLYVDVSSTSSGPATVLQTVSYGGPVHYVQDSTASAVAFVSVGGTSLFKYTINEAGPTYLTQVGSLTTLSQPRGFNLEGPGNDLIVAQVGGGGQAVAVNTTSLAIDQSLTIGGSPNGVSGPNASSSCALVEDNTTNVVSAVGIDPNGSATAAQIGASIVLPGAPVGVTYFPPSISGTGTAGLGTTTALVPTPGTGVVLSCNGTSFTSPGTYASFMSTPAAAAPSGYASTVVPGLVYVVGSDNGTPQFYAYSQYTSFPVFKIASPGSTSAAYSAVTSGP